MSRYSLLALPCRIHVHKVSPWLDQHMSSSPIKHFSFSNDYQQTRGASLMLGWRWPSVYDAGPISAQHAEFILHVLRPSAFDRVHLYIKSKECPWASYDVKSECDSWSVARVVDSEERRYRVQVPLRPIFFLGTRTRTLPMSDTLKN